MCSLIVTAKRNKLTQLYDPVHSSQLAFSMFEVKCVASAAASAQRASAALMDRPTRTNGHHNIDRSLASASLALARGVPDKTDTKGKARQTDTYITVSTIFMHALVI